MLTIYDKKNDETLSPESAESIQRLHALAREFGGAAFIGITQELGRFWCLTFYALDLHHEHGMLFRLVRLDPERFEVKGIDHA